MSAIPDWYQLRNALFDEDFRAAEALLDTNQRLLDERNGIGETVLHFLAVENSYPGVAWLHSKGASLDAKNKFGTPLLFEVAQLGYRDLYGRLVEMGVDTSQTDDLGRSISEFLREYDHDEMADFVEATGKR